MAKRGRKNGYETTVKPHFDNITEWLRSGATERQIAQNIGVGYSTFAKYKAENIELQELIKNGRQSLVAQLRGALVKKALGFSYEEKKTYIKKDADGKKAQYTEIQTKQALPDVAALNLCLKNYDSENWANDPQALELKRAELEMKKELQQLNEW